jgi:hypothetical protein
VIQVRLRMVVVFQTLHKQEDIRMTARQQIERDLVMVRRRIRWIRALIGLIWGLFGASLIWFSGVVLWLLFPIPRVWVSALGALVPIAGMAGFFWGMFRGVDRVVAARLADRKLGLKERFSSAVLFLDRDLEGDAAEPSEGMRLGLERLVVEDAAKRTRGLRWSEALPLHFPRVWRWALLASVLAFGMAFIPPYRTKAFREAEQDREVIETQGKRLIEEAERRELEARANEWDDSEVAAQDLRELGQVLEGGMVDRREAMQEVGKLVDKLHEQPQQALSQPSVSRMAQRQAFSKTGSSGPSRQALQRQLERLKQQLGTQSQPSMQQLDQLRNQLAKAQQSLDKARQSGEPMSAEQQQALNQLLSQMAQSAEGLGAFEQNLEDAIEALSKMDIGAVTQDLDDAVVNLEEMSKKLAEIQKLQNEMDKLGKDLPEMLQRGQMQPAADRLRELAKQLQSGQKPTQEQLEKMAEELQKAMAESEPFGDLGDMLQKAMDQMSAEQMQQAAETMKDAAAELEKLAQQMEDMKSMGKMLEALRDAQMKIASRGQGGNKPGSCPFCGGAGCSACMGTGMGKPSGRMTEFSGSPGGGAHQVREGEFPGGGDLWQTPRVNADRREGVSTTSDSVEDVDIPAEAEPWRVRGQMTQGGPMPGVPLPGLSIKGASSVQLQEATEAARREAADALSREPIPKAYRDVVRQYFDQVPTEELVEP